MSKMIKVSDYIIKFLEEQGVKHMFMLSGGMAMHIDDSVGFSKKLKPICMLHEQGCTFAAELSVPPVVLLQLTPLPVLLVLG